MKLSVETLGAALAVVHLDGRVDVSSAPIIKTQLVGVVEAGKTHLLLDLSEVDFVDSTGLSVFVSVLRRVAERQGAIALVVVDDGVRRIFEVTRLDQVFTIVKDRKQGLEVLQA